MATIERKALPPLNSRAIPITEADRADIIAHANDVIDYNLNGPGSYFDGGTQKPLESEFGESAIDDLQNFKAGIIASKQFADDPESIMDSVIDLIDKKIIQVKKAAEYKEGKSIWASPPDANDSIDDPRVISPRALGNGILPISLSVKGEEPASALEEKGITPRISSTKPIRYLGRRGGSTPPVRASDTGAPAAQFVLPDRLKSSRPPHRLGYSSDGPRSALSDAIGITAASSGDARNLEHQAGAIFEPDDCRPVACIRI